MYKAYLQMCTICMHVLRIFCTETVHRQARLALLIQRLIAFALRSLVVVIIIHLLRGIVCKMCGKRV